MLTAILATKAFAFAASTLFVDGIVHIPFALKQDLENGKSKMPETTWATAKAGLGCVGMYAAIAAIIL